MSYNPPGGQQPNPYGQQPDPYAQQQQNPYGQQPDPYAQQQQQQNPYGQQPGAQPYQAQPGAQPYQGQPAPGQFPGAPPVNQFQYQQGPLYASWGTRAAARIIDGLIPSVIMGIGWGIYIASIDTYTATVSPAGMVAALVFYLAGGGFTIWNIWIRQGKTGQSIGKSAMKIRLVSEATMQPVGIGMSCVRNITDFINAFFYIGYLFPLWDQKKQTLTDKIISSIVISA